MATQASPDPCTMMALASYAYDPLLSPLPSGQVVVWGPKEAGLPSYAAALITYSSSSDAYTVVIRGTDPLSWNEWTKEDFAILPTELFNQFAQNAPSGAQISAGAFNGLKDLLKLKDREVGILDYLKSVDPTLVYVTGHSLGGTLTPPLFACINYELYGGTKVDNMAPCSFAGLTAGNADFNTYFSGLFTFSGSWRFYNTLDFAPMCWDSFSGVENIYTPWNLAYGTPESDLLTPLFQEAAGAGFVQPSGGYALSGSYDSFHDHWATQAIYQHHHSTYQKLVEAAFCP